MKYFDQRLDMTSESRYSHDIINCETKSLDNRIIPTTNLGLMEYLQLKLHFHEKFKTEMRLLNVILEIVGRVYE